MNDVLVPVALNVSAQAGLTISKSHTGNFVQGQRGVTYSITVGNGLSAGPTNGTVTVTEEPPSGETVVSMTSTGNVWTCNAGQCTTNNSIASGESYPLIMVTVNVSPDAATQLTNVATVSGGDSSTSPSYGDTANIAAFTCAVTSNHVPTINDVQQFVNAALGLDSPPYTLNSDGVVNVKAVQIVINAAVSGTCPP